MARRPSRPRAALLASLALAVFAAPADLRAQEGGAFLEAYKRGVAAVEAEDWPRAEELMRAAIAGRAEEAERLVRHFHLRPYLPHFYLGLALAEQGACAAALDAFAESERQGIVAALAAELAVLRARSAACREVLAAEAEAAERRAAVAELVARAESAAASIAELASDPALAPTWERGERSLASRLAEARLTIGRARERLTAGEAGLEAAADLARGALGQLEAIRRETDLRRQAAAEAREAATERLAGLVRTARDLEASTRNLAPEAPSIARARSALEAARGDAARDAAALTAAEIGDLAGLLERRIAALRSAAAPPPEALLGAAGAWLRGDPRGVLEALAGPRGAAAGEDDLPFRDPRERAHALLLRAAALFALHEGAADGDDASLEAARSAAAECRRLAPELEPVPGAFPPRFRSFWATVAAGPAPPPPTR